MTGKVRSLPTSRPLHDLLAESMARTTDLLADANDTAAAIPGSWLEPALTGLITEAMVMMNERFAVNPPRRDDRDD